MLLYPLEDGRTRAKMAEQVFSLDTLPMPKEHSFQVPPSLASLPLCIRMRATQIEQVLRHHPEL